MLSLQHYLIRDKRVYFGLVAVLWAVLAWFGAWSSSVYGAPEKQEIFQRIGLISQYLFKHYHGAFSPW